MTDEQMRADLARSGLLPEDLSATPATQGDPGYIIPYFLPDRRPHPTMYRKRLIPVPAGMGKYTQPSKEALKAHGLPVTDASYPYLPPVLDWLAVARSTGPVGWWGVEGEKKAVCVFKYAKVPAFGFGGANMLTVADDETGVHTLHPVLAGLFRKGDTVYLLFDADVRTNENVALGAGTARHCLTQLGINVVFVQVPPGAGGIDDYLMKQPVEVRPKALQDLPRTDGATLPVNRATIAKYLGLAVNAKGALILNESNIRKILDGHPRYKGRIYFDVVKKWLYETVTDGTQRIVTDPFCFHEALWMQRHIHPMIKPPMVLNTITAMAHTHQRNVFAERLRSVVWDKTPRMEEMFIRGWGVEDTQYTRAVGCAWLTSVVARALDPGCQVDTMLVLEGPQGSWKSRSLHALGGEWYTELSTSMENQKDFLMAAHRALIADIPELSGFTKSDFNHIKALITIRTDEMRPPYERNVRSLQRRFVLTGTTNDKGYLRDPTGNRRFLPVECRKIDIAWIETHRAQLFAEAKVRYDSGTPWWIDDSITAAAQGARLAVDPWVEAVGQYLEMFEAQPPNIGTKVRYHFVTTGMLLSAVGVTIDKASVAMTQRLSQIMSSNFPQWNDYRYDGKPIAVPSGVVTRARGFRKLQAGQVMVPAPVVDIKSPPPTSPPPVSPGGFVGSDDPGKNIGTNDPAGGSRSETPGTNPFGEGHAR